MFFWLQLRLIQLICEILYILTIAADHEDQQEHDSQNHRYNDWIIYFHDFSNNSP